MPSSIALIVAVAVWCWLQGIIPSAAAAAVDNISSGQSASPTTTLLGTSTAIQNNAKRTDATAASPQAARTMGPKSPNVVVILTDDQDLHLGSLDHMPYTQSLLMMQGLTFNKHYAHVSLCCPSRATMWTGKHAHNTNVTSVRNDVAGGAWTQVQKSGWYKDSLAAWMQEAGYNTYYAGKIYNGLGKKNYCKPHCLQGWTKGDFLLDPSMYRYYNSSWVSVNGNAWGEPERRTGYTTDQVTDYMINYIDDAVASNKPFMAIAAPVAVHVSAGISYKDVGVSDIKKQFPFPVPKKEYLNLFPDIKIPRTYNFNPANRSGGPPVWALDQLSEENIEMQEYYYRLRAATLASVDDMVKDVVQTLENKGILDNTYIIFTSDNGFHLGNHRLQPGKEQCFEEDVNVPFIIRGPDVIKNEKTDLVTGHIDLAPTILKIANASLDGHALDGTPITFPLLKKTDFERNYAFRGEFTHLEYWGPFHQEGPHSEIGVDFKKNLQTYKALRMQHEKYSLMYSVWCQDGAHELYDMISDPHQMTNLHPDAPVQDGAKQNAYSSGMDTFMGRPTEQVIYRLDAFVLIQKTCSGDVCRHPWRQLHPASNITSLEEALHPKYDRFYEAAYKNAQVGWLECYTGYSKHSSATLYSLENESPAWTNVEIRAVVMKGAAHSTRSLPVGLPLYKWWPAVLAFLFAS